MRASRRESDVRRQPSARIAAIATLLLLPLLVYAAGLRGEFVQDDVALIQENAKIRSLGSLGSILTSSYRDGTPIRTEDSLYRPVTIASFAVQYALCGLEPAAYHAANAILHGAVSVLILAVLVALGFSAPVAFGAALLYAVHPAVSEAVIVCSGRAELLAGFFLWLAWWVLLRDRRLERPLRTGILAGLLALLALGSKESAVVLPGLVLLGDLLVRARAEGTSLAAAFRRLGRPELLRAGILAGAVGVYLAARYAVLGRLGLPSSEIPFLDNPAAHASTGERLVTAVSCLGRYLAKLVLPLGLSADYSYAQIPVRSSPDAAGILAALVAVATILLALRRGETPRVLAFGGAFFFVAISVASNVVFPVGTIFGERLLYVPAAGLCAVLAHALHRLPSRRAAVGAIAVVAALYGVRGALRAPDFADRESFAVATAEASPRSAKARYNHANVLLGRGDRAAAIDEYRAAIDLHGEYAKAWINLGGALLLDGALDEAEEALARATELAPSEAIPWVTLSDVLLRQERWNDAVRALERARERSRGEPHEPEVLLRLGEAHILAGALPAARRSFEEALRVAPGHRESLLRVARIRISDGDRDGAKKLLRRVLSLDRDDPEALDLLRGIGSSP